MDLAGYRTVTIFLFATASNVPSWRNVITPPVMTGEAACRYVFRIQSPLHLIHSSDRFLTRIVLIEPTRLGRFSLAFRRSDQSFQRPAVVARSDQELAIRALGVRMPPGSAKSTNRALERILFESPITARYVRLLANSEGGGRARTSVAELSVIALGRVE